MKVERMLTKLAYISQPFLLVFANIQSQDRSGSTAVCAMVTPTHIIIANLGMLRINATAKLYQESSHNIISMFLVFFIFGYVADVDFESLVGTCPQN